MASEVYIRNKMKQTNLFPQPRPWSPELVSAEQDLRAKNRARVHALPKAELPFQASDVSAYLRETSRAELIPGGRDPNVDRLAYEEALTQDLEEAQMREDGEAVQRLRKLILAGSLTVNKNKDPKAPVRCVQEMLAILEKQKTDLERHSHDDAESMDDSIARIELLNGAIVHDIRGDELEDVVRTAEEEYRSVLKKALHLHHRRGRKNIRRDDLPRIRIVRDAVYMQYLFPYMRQSKQKRVA